MTGTHKPRRQLTAMLTRWWNLEHSTKSARRSRIAKDMIAKLTSSEGSFSSHSAQGLMLPIYIEACHVAGKSFTITAIAADGRIIGYMFDTRIKHEVGRPVACNVCGTPDPHACMICMRPDCPGGGGPA